MIAKIQVNQMLFSISSSLYVASEKLIIAGQLYFFSCGRFDCAFTRNPVVPFGFIIEIFILKRIE